MGRKIKGKGPRKPKDNPGQQEIAEFTNYLTAIKNTANIPDVLEKNIGIIENFKASIEDGDKNKARRFKAFMAFQETQEYYSRAQKKKDEAAIEDARRKLHGEYDWPEEGADLSKMRRDDLNEYAEKLGMDADEVKEYKTKTDLIKAIEEAMED